MPEIIFILAFFLAACFALYVVGCAIIFALELVYQTLRVIGLAITMLGAAAWWSLTALPRLAWFLTRQGWRLGRAILAADKRTMQRAPRRVRP